MSVVPWIHDFTWHVLVAASFQSATACSQTCLRLEPFPAGQTLSISCQPIKQQHHGKFTLGDNASCDQCLGTSREVDRTLTEQLNCMQIFCIKSVMGALFSFIVLFQAVSNRCLLFKQSHSCSGTVVDFVYRELRAHLVSCIDRQTNIYTEVC